VQTLPADLLTTNCTYYAKPPEIENPINPIYGLSLLEWLRIELRDQLVISEPDAEDWGWYSEVEFDGYIYLLGSSALSEEGDDPSSEIEGIFQVEKHRSIKEKLVGKNKMDASDTCFVFFKEHFEKEPNMAEVTIG